MLNRGFDEICGAFSRKNTPRVAVAFLATIKWKTNPILLIVLAGVVGFVVYYGIG